VEEGRGKVEAWVVVSLFRRNCSLPYRPRDAIHLVQSAEAPTNQSLYLKVVERRYSCTPKTIPTNLADGS
jgi:hypothetical protein